MSISYVKTILENASNCEAWSLQILKIHHTKKVVLVILVEKLTYLQLAD